MPASLPQAALPYSAQDFAPRFENGFQNAWVYSQVNTPEYGSGNYMLRLDPSGRAERNLFYGGTPTTPGGNLNSFTTWSPTETGFSLGDGGAFTFGDGGYSLRDTIPDAPDLGPLAVSLSGDKSPLYQWLVNVDDNAYRSTGAALKDSAINGIPVSGFFNLDIDKGPRPLFSSPTIEGRPYDWVTFREDTPGGRWGNLLNIETADGPRRAGMVADDYGASLTTDWWPTMNDRGGLRIGSASDPSQHYDFAPRSLLMNPAERPDFWWWDLYDTLSYPGQAPLSGWWEHTLRAR